jgi:hypothetical protein
LSRNGIVVTFPDPPDIVTVSKIMRHSQTSITVNVYGHMLEGAGAQAMDRLDKRLRPAQ